MKCDRAMPKQRRDPVVGRRDIKHQRDARRLRSAVPTRRKTSGTGNDPASLIGDRQRQTTIRKPILRRLHPRPINARRHNLHLGGRIDFVSNDFASVGHDFLYWLVSACFPSSLRITKTLRVRRTRQHHFSSGDQIGVRIGNIDFQTAERFWIPFLN